MGRFATLEAPADFGLRADNTPKGKGFFGTLKLPDGRIATEYSVGVQFDGAETEIPSLVPTLTQNELNLLINDIIPNQKSIPDTILQKAVDHAKLRIGQGKSPFAQEGEQINRPPSRFSKEILEGTRFSRGAMGSQTTPDEPIDLFEDIIPPTGIPEIADPSGLPTREFDPIMFGESIAEEFTRPAKGAQFIPILGGVVGSAENLLYLDAAQRLRSGFDYTKPTRPEELVPGAMGIRPARFTTKEADIKLIEDLILRTQERQERGLSLGGQFAKGILNLPTWMAEFALTGGLANLGSAAAKTAGAKLIGRWATTKAGQIALRGAGWTGGAITRATLGLTPRIAEKTLERQVGIQILGADQEGWATSFAKSWGDVTIEAASETAGQTITGVPIKLLGKTKFGGKFINALRKGWMKATGGKAAMFAKKMASRGGFSNLIGEIGEERLGTVLRAITDVEDFGAGKDAGVTERLRAGIASDIEGIVAEVAVLSLIPGGQVALGTAARIGQAFRPSEISAQKRGQAIEFVRNALRQEKFAALDEKARAEIGQRMLAEQGVDVELEELAETPATEGQQAPDIAPERLLPPEAVEIPQKPAEPEAEAGALKVADMTLDELKKVSAIFDKKIETEKARLDKIDPERQIFGGTGIEHLSPEDASRMVAINNEIGRRVGTSQVEAQKRVAEKRAARKAAAAPERGKRTVAEIQSEITELKILREDNKKLKGTSQFDTGLNEFVAKRIKKKTKEIAQIKVAGAKAKVARKALEQKKIESQRRKRVATEFGREELRRQIANRAAKIGLTKTALDDLKLEHTGFRTLTGKVSGKKITDEQLQDLLKAVILSRPNIIGHKKVVSLKTEKQIEALRLALTDLGYMNDTEFKKILDREVRGKPAKYVNAKNFITQREGREILARMHDTAQRLRVTEPVRRAVGRNLGIAREIRKIGELPKKTKDPSELKSIRFFFQRLGEQARAPIYEIYLDLAMEGQTKSRERHKSTKLAEKLPDFAKIANDPVALQRVEDWIVSQSTLKDKPEFPEKITQNEVRLAKLVQASWKSYETLARTGKFFEFFDNRTEIPQYLRFQQSIDKAFDIYNTKGYDALIEYLDTQDWGIVSAGYSPMDSIVKKVSTHRMPDIAVGKGHIKQRGIVYQVQDRDILQRWYSYMRQMDQLIHLQPRIKSLVRLINDNMESFVNPRRMSNVVSTYLDNLKHTNYEDGLAERWIRRLYSQAITVRVLADPLKVFRNLAQNAAFSEDRRDFLDPRNKKLNPKDVEYLETYVQQASVMMTDWAFVGEDPILFKRLTKWVQRNTLYPSSDRTNRLISFHAKINRVRRAFAKEQSLVKKMRAARFGDMQKNEQKTALGILAKDGVDDMARYVAKVHTDNTHFLYAREERSPAEQTRVGKLAFNLFLFRRAALEKALLQLSKVFQKGTGFRAKRRAASVLVTLLGMSALVGILWKKVTGQKYSPYSYFSFLEINFGGLAVATIEKAEDVFNSMLSILTMDPKKRGKAIEDFGTDLTKSADYMIPFYDIGLRSIEATIGSENIDRIPARKLRELIDKEYKSRGLSKIDRSLVEKIQFTFAKGGKVEKKEPRKFKFGKR